MAQPPTSNSFFDLHVCVCAFEAVQWQIIPQSLERWYVLLLLLVVGDSQALHTPWHDYNNVWYQIAYNSYLGCTRQPFAGQKVPAKWRGWPTVDPAVEHATRVPEEPLRFSFKFLESIAVRSPEHDDAEVKKYKFLQDPTHQYYILVIFTYCKYL